MRLLSWLYNHLFERQRVRQCCASGCKYPALTEGWRKFSMCAYHLEKAKMGFRKHARSCRKSGTCVCCALPATPGELRCPRHKEINHARSRAWAAAHPWRSREDWLKRKALYNDKGLCPACKGHPPVASGKAKCQACLDRARRRHHERREKARKLSSRLLLNFRPTASLR